MTRVFQLFNVTSTKMPSGVKMFAAAFDALVTPTTPPPDENLSPTAATLKINFN